MTARLVVLLVLAWQLVATGVHAQEGNEGADSLPDETPEYIPAAEVEQSVGEESGPTGEETGEAAEPGLPVCEEETQEELLPDEPAIEDEPEEEEGAGEDIDPEQDFEVSPEDEISEDYPVPLPSDI